MKKTLYHKAKTGKVVVWSVWTEGSKICTESGQLEGKLTLSEKIATPKNIGKSNEINAEDQANIEALAMWQKKKDHKYKETIEEAEKDLLLPMLAKEFEPKRVSFPCYAQPKLDGNRALAFWDEGEIKLLSRGGKVWTVPAHINKQLEDIIPLDCMLDGELYIHGKSLQTISSYLKKYREETDDIEYHVYDVPIWKGNRELTFEERYDHLKYLALEQENDFNGMYTPSIKFLETVILNEESQIKEYEAKCIDDKYEGAIVRNSSGLYQFGYRSSDLLKVKTFQDSEFKVLSCRDGIGKFVGCAIFVCQNDLNDRTFECTLATTMEEKAQMFKEQEKYIGKFLTVKYKGRSDDLIPCYPVGKCFKMQEEL